MRASTSSLHQSAHSHTFKYRTKTLYSITETQYKRHAVEVLEKLDTSSVDGIIIAGGDGLVHEVSDTGMHV
jgi:diacylglycerol kinase family enzyme